MTYDAVTVRTPFGAFTAIADDGTVVSSGFTAGADELRDRLPDPRREIRVRTDLGPISSALGAYFTGPTSPPWTGSRCGWRAARRCAASGTRSAESPPERFAVTRSWGATADMRGSPAPRVPATPSRSSSPAIGWCAPMARSEVSAGDFRSNGGFSTTRRPHWGGAPRSSKPADLRHQTPGMSRARPAAHARHCGNDLLRRLSS